MILEQVPECPECQATETKMRTREQTVFDRKGGMETRMRFHIACLECNHETGDYDSHFDALNEWVGAPLVQEPPPPYEPQPSDLGALLLTLNKHMKETNRWLKIIANKSGS